MMKNSDMRVTELLDSKKELECEIAGVEKAIWMIDIQKDPNLSDKRYNNVANLFSAIGSTRLILDAKHLRPALEAQLAEFKAELEPINKKLEAIELMLSS